MKRTKTRVKRPQCKRTITADDVTIESRRDGMATVKEAANFLRFCTKTIDRMIKAGKLRSRKIGRSRRIPWSVLREYAGDPATSTA